MSTAVALRETPEQVRVCTITSDLPRFGLLVEELDGFAPEAWGNLTLEEAPDWLAGEHGGALEFAALVLGPEDEEDLEPALAVVRRAHELSITLLVVARDLSPATLHRLLSEGASGFLPYPLPDGALAQAVARLQQPETPQPRGTGAARNGTILPVHGLAGGVGATTFAVNLAWELANLGKTPPRVCLLDLDLQFGSVSTLLDLPRRDAVAELWSEAAALDAEALDSTLVTHAELLPVLTAPADIMPLDFVGPDEVQRLLGVARARFDYVVIDMPTAVTQWTETVLKAAHVYFAPLTLDMRSAQNALRLLRALKVEGLPHERLRFVLNRAPGKWDRSGKARAARLAETLEVALDVQLPDGGRAVREAGDYGQPLAQYAPRTPLRKEIGRLAAALHELNQTVTAEA